MATAAGSAAGSTLDLRDRLLLSFEGRWLSPAGAEAIARRAAGVTLYRHLNVGSPAEVRALTDELQAAAARIGRSALLVGADHETGQLHAMGDGATPFPGAMALGAVGDEGLVERVGAAIGAELRAMGLNVVYAPVCDLATNPRNPVVGIRSFGHDPAAVGRLAAATVRGLQSAGVAATIKHFPGHGDPSADSHRGLPVINRGADELRERELVPFAAAIDAGARVAMAGHLGVPALTGRRDLPATLAPEILRTLLRGDLGFGGLTVSDALDMGAVSSHGGVDVAAALGAGTDLLLCGPDPEAQVRVERRWIAGFPVPAVEVVGCTDHRLLADEVARRSITLIRDRDGLLPVAATDVRRALVVEPRPRDLSPADTTSWLPPGGLAAALAERLPEIEGVIVGPSPTADEIAVLRERAGSSDLVVLGTVDALGQPAVVELARALAATGCPVVAVALRAPWDSDAYPEIGTVVATYGIQPPSLAALADALVGDHPITGRLPVRLAGG